MANYSYENVKVLFVEKNREVRKNASAVLRDRGFRKVEETTSFERIEQAIGANEIDLLICDAQMEGHDILEFVRKIRHGEFGKNPFMVIILLSHDLAADRIAEIIDSGTDDLLVKPLIPSLLADRIRQLIVKRKGFVVTSDYIGPDRRSAPRPGRQQVPIIEVPNALKFAAEGNTNKRRLQAKIDACKEEVNAQKMTRQAYQIKFLANIIVPILSDEDKPNFDAVPYYGRILFFTKDLKGRIKDTAMQDAVELCDSLIDVTNTILKNPERPAEKDVRSLSELAQSINQAFAEHDEADVSKPAAPVQSENA